jgi:hypothetical protein
MNQIGFGQGQPPFFHVRPNPLPNEIGASLAVVMQQAERVASAPPVTRGEAAGRVDSAVAIGGLMQAAFQPLETTMQAIAEATGDTYGRMLDLCKIAWPAGKAISVTAEDNLISTMIMNKEHMPTRQQVVVTAGPLTPMGRMSEFEKLMFLRSQNPPLIDDLTFRRGLAAIGMQIPGVKVYDEMDRLARYKCQMIYNDGQTPGQWDGRMDRTMRHKSTIERMIEFVNRVEFRQLASPQVQLAFEQALAYHTGQMNGNFQQTTMVDSESEEILARRIDNSVDISELDPSNMSMDFQIA